MECKAGDILCGCILRQMCGTGAYGEVWLAEDAVGARVALKIIRNRGSYSERELSGLKNYKDCNHPNLLKIRYVEISDDRICCIMDAADDLHHGRGQYQPDTLANRLRENGRMDGGEIVVMLDGLLNGLEELHKRGLVHRDIKPDNILWVNGRPTLADAGLIAPQGKGSLVGTPGFMSPKLLTGKGKADPSDDFYALGKVIYCALTGLPVEDYPSIPENMTISTDAALGRALRDSCSQPVRSSAEFRKLMQGKDVKPVPGRKTKSVPTTVHTDLSPGVKLLLFLILIAVLSVGGIYAYANLKPKTAPYVMSPEEEAALDAQLAEVEKQLANAQETMRKSITKDNDVLKDAQERAAKLFREDGLIPEKENMIQVLLSYQVMTGHEIIDLLWNSNRNPRLQPTAGVHPRTSKPLSDLEQEFSNMFSAAYPDFDRNKVRERQNFWQRQYNPAARIQQSMLETDPVMQALALDAIIRHEVNAILEEGAFQKGEKARLRTLFELRYELIMPQAGRRELKSWSCFED